MKVFDGYGNLIESAFDADALEVIRTALTLAEDSKGAGTRGRKCKPGHVLLALLDTSLGISSDRARIIRAALVPPARLSTVVERIRAYSYDVDAASRDFDLRRNFFDDVTLKALEHADRPMDSLGRIAWEAKLGQRICVDALWLSILLNRGPDENALTPLLDFSRATDLFIRLLRGQLGPHRDLYLASGELDPDCFSESAFEVLNVARDRAGSLGAPTIQGPHLFLGLLAFPDGPAAQAIRLQCHGEVGPAAAGEHLEQMLRVGRPRSAGEIPLDRDHLGKSLRDALGRAQALTELYGAPAITQAMLSCALVEDENDGPVARSLAEALPSLNRARLLDDLEELARASEDDDDIRPFLLTGIAGASQDLTYQARTRPQDPSVQQDSLVEQVLRGLHKRVRNSILITGESGVGKTQLVIEVSRRIAAGEVKFLQRKKIVRVDCSEMTPENSRVQLERVIGEVKGRRDVIVCLDRMENILRHAGQRDATNIPILYAALAAGSLQIIGILEERYYIELLSGDHRMLEQFSRVEVGQLDVETAHTVLAGVWKERYERTYKVSIDDDALEKAARASDEFIMSERLPSKAIKVLGEACERVAYDVACSGSTNDRVTEADVVRAVSGMTGIPASTIAGVGERDHFAREFARSVVGQKSAVESVVSRLKLIRAGAIRAGRPAAVFLFAGPTGTGKTELAKAVARVYSASHRLIRYDMTRFSLEHSIQGLLGVPPGYVGYESGGQLVNDLNADPYSVILFDEAEKAHRSIWQGMLSLFDEGWVVDQRNVKAYGNRAIFILTSNAGKDLIEQRFRRDIAPGDLDTLKQEVQDALVNYVDPQTHNRPFPPEFLGRLTDVAVFGPLSREAFDEITRLQIDALVAEWKTARKKVLVVEQAVKAKISEESVRVNSGYGGGRGGRAVQAAISRHVELTAVRLIEEQPEEYGRAAGIRILLGSDRSAMAMFEPAGEVATT